MTEKMLEELLSVAKQAREESYSPYSKFSTGAAVLTEERRVFSGANIENSSYGLTICAERVAIYKAVAAGYRDFKALIVIADTEKPVSLCGACRQVLLEFGQDIIVFMANLKGDIKKSTSGELLPGGFSGKDINNGL